jgi:hypothetical protein
MTQTTLASAADYADSLLVARRTKIVVSVLILFILVAQLTLFFVVRYGYPHLLEAPATTADRNKTELIQYTIGMLDFAGMILPAVLTVTLFILLQIQLVGRLVGTAKMTSALLWSVMLCLLLFPWQSVLNNPAINADPAATAIGLKIPGVLYTWSEFSNGKFGATFTVGKDWTKDWAPVVLHWTRFCVAPVIAVLILIWIQFKSDGGLRQSLGGGDPVVPATNPVI